MSLPASDNYNRADETPIAGNWSAPTGVDPFDLRSNVAWPRSGANYSVAYWNADVFANNQKSQVTLGGSAIASWWAGAAGRVQSGALTGYFFGNVQGVYKLMYLNAGSATVLQTGSGTPTAGDVMTIEANGTGLTGKVNGVSNAVATDASIASGQAGKFGYGSTGVITLDDWQGDNLGAAATTSRPIFSRGLRFIRQSFVFALIFVRSWAFAIRTSPLWDVALPPLAPLVHQGAC